MVQRSSAQALSIAFAARCGFEDAAGVLNLYFATLRGWGQNFVASISAIPFANYVRIFCKRVRMSEVLGAVHEIDMWDCVCIRASEPNDKLNS
jgi:hypothetical protein